MSESKHTPGPWVAADKASWFRGQTHPDEGKIAITAGSGGVVANAYGRDNARLIAAAPEMLEALKELRDAFKIVSDDDWQHPSYRVALAAIAKAEGRA